MKMGDLQDVLRINNEGTAMMASANLEATRLALSRFNEALTRAASLEGCDLANKGKEDFDDRGMNDLCLYSKLAISKADDDSFYFFDQVMHIKPNVFVGPMKGNMPRTITFLAAILLMNSGLGHYQLGHAFLGHRYTARAKELFRRSLELYGKAVVLIGILNSTSSRKGATAMMFYQLAAQNNYLCLCVRLGLTSKAKAALKATNALVEEAGHLLPQDAMTCVEEIILNTAILTMTNVFAKLPAPAA